MTPYAMVVQFNQEVLNIIPRPKQLQNSEEVGLSITQLHEELKELGEAWALQDYVAAIDAVIDMMYFAQGILYKMGISDDEYQKIFEIVHAANMSKKPGVKEGREGFDAVDAVKPEDFVSPEDAIMRILGEIQ